MVLTSSPDITEQCNVHLESDVISIQELCMHFEGDIRSGKQGAEEEYERFKSAMSQYVRTVTRVSGKLSATLVYTFELTSPCAPACSEIV